MGGTDSKMPVFPCDRSARSTRMTSTSGPVSSAPPLVAMVRFRSCASRWTRLLIQFYTVMKLMIKVDDKGIISDVKFKTFGCGSAIASSSYITERVRGLSLDQAAAIRNTEIANVSVLHAPRCLLRGIPLRLAKNRLEGLRALVFNPLSFEQELNLPPVKLHCSMLAYVDSRTLRATPARFRADLTIFRVPTARTPSKPRSRTTRRSVRVVTSRRRSPDTSMSA